MQHHTRLLSAYGRSHLSRKVLMAEDPQGRRVTHFRIEGAWTEAFHPGLTNQDRKEMLTASDGQQETSTVISKVEDGEARLQQLQEDVIVKAQVIMEIRKRMCHTNAGSKRKVVDEGEHRQPLIREITTSPMISDGGILECINRNAVSAGDPMGA